MFVPLRNHSHYSLLLSTARCNQIAEKCAKSGYKYAGLTDLGTVSGCVNFIQACKKHDLKPIIGSEINIKEGGTLTLICKNNNAWRELLVLTSLCNDPENYNKQPEISFDDLVKTITPDNFIVIDGYVGSHFFYSVCKDVAGALCHQDSESVKNCLHDNWGDLAHRHFIKLSPFKSYYLEVNLEEFDTIPVFKIMAECVSHLDPNHNITIPDSASYYCDANDALDHRVLLCAKLKTTLKKLDTKILETEAFDLIKFTRSSKFHIKNDLDSSLYPDNLVSNMQKLVDECEDLVILSNPRLPTFDCPETGMTENDFLKQLCRDGWAKLLKGKLDKEQTIIYRDRVLKELAVIEKANLAGYFLIVQDYVNHFRNQGCLVGPGRGCFLGDTRVKMGNGLYRPISDVEIGEEVIDAYGDKRKVLDQFVYDIDEEIVQLEMENGKVIRCTKDHKFLTENRGWVQADELTEEDDIIEI